MEDEGEVMASTGWGSYRRRCEAARMAERVLTSNAKKDKSDVTVDEILKEAVKIDAWIYQGKINGEVERESL